MQLKKGKVPDPQTESDIESYGGAAIKVAFSKEMEPQPIQGLSGGQKSLVSLALIFAIQQCDDAPFYIFDEIDSALDPVHRTAVARMIVSRSKDAQFIITTFTQEMLEIGKKFYLISQDKGRVSTISSVSKERALNLITEATGRTIGTDVGGKHYDDDDDDDDDGDDDGGDEKQKGKGRGKSKHIEIEEEEGGEGDKAEKQKGKGRGKSKHIEIEEVEEEGEEGDKAEKQKGKGRGKSKHIEIEEVEEEGEEEEEEGDKAEKTDKEVTSHDESEGEGGEDEDD